MVAYVVSRSEQSIVVRLSQVVDVNVKQAPRDMHNIGNDSVAFSMNRAFKAMIHLRRDL